MTITLDNTIILKQGVDYSNITELRQVIECLLLQGYSMESIDTEPISTKG